MRKSYLTLVILLTTLVLPYTIKAQSSDTYTVVVSLDGFRWDYPNFARTPTLDSLARVGVKAHMEPCFPSVTFPNHYSMATGLHPDKHGIVHNTFYDNKLEQLFTIGNRNAVANKSFWFGEPIWITAMKQGLKTACFFWPGSETNEQHPDTWKPFDSNVPYTDRADSVIMWLQKPIETRPRLIMWYIEEPDMSGHIYGPTSKKLIAKVEQLDSILNYYFTKARGLDNFDKINFMVVSDHGMAQLTEKEIQLDTIVDIKKLEILAPGSPFMILYAKNEHREDIYKNLKNTRHLSVWKIEECPKDFFYGTSEREGNLIVLADIGYTLKFGNSSKYVNRGAHGFDPEHPDMVGILYAAGPAFKKGYTHGKSFKNLNLYNIIARTLGITPAPNQGDLEIISPLFK